MRRRGGWLYLSLTIIGLLAVLHIRVGPVANGPALAGAGSLRIPASGITFAQAGDLVLYDGEPGSAPLPDPSCTEYAADTTEAALSGTHSLRLNPDPWHKPALRLYCAGQPRRNLSGYDVIEFHMRAADPANPPANPTFQVTTWHATSNTVPVLDYTEGGVLDGAWRRVQIPISALKTADWDLGDVEFLLWGPDSESRASFVDDVVARDVTPPALQQVAIESHRYLRLRFSERFDPYIARDTTHYTLTSEVDPAYAPAQQPTAAGFEWRVVDFGGSTPRGQSGAPALRFDVTLRLPAPLQPGVLYTLTVAGITDAVGNPMSPTSVPITFDPEAPNPNIKVNQVGYVPHGPKWGYVGGYLGDLGGGVWTVGENGTILRWNPSTGWTIDQSPIPNLQSPISNTSTGLSTSLQSPISNLQSPPPTLRAVYPLTEYDVWAVGDAGVVLHWDGTHWQAVGVPTTVDLYDISFTPQAEGWIVGGNGTTLHWPPGGTAWEQVPTSTTATLRGVYAEDAETAWAVGDAGALLRWDGEAWSAISSPTTTTLYDVGGFPGAGAWAVGANSAILEWRWGNWQVVESPVTATLRHVSGAPNGGAVVVGDGGVVLRKTGFGDEAFDPEVTPGTTDLQSVAFLDARQGFAFGAGGMAYRFDDDTGAWVGETLPVTTTLQGAAALPYGALRIVDYLTARNQVFSSKSREMWLFQPSSLARTLSITEEKPGFFPPTTVDIVDTETGAVALTVPLVLRAANWHLSGEDLYAFDFSALATPGTYRARVAGLGVSDPFVVAGDVYREAARIAARGLYQQRCGTALTLTDHPHGVCHAGDAVFHDSLAASPLYNGEPVGGVKNVVGGWHDAGDYGKYVPTGASALWFLLSSFELARDPALRQGFDRLNPAAQDTAVPGHGQSFGDDWGIPESGNGVPDLLDEARWELDWLVRLQDTGGGVYFKVTTACWFAGMPDASTETRYILPKTTHSTAMAAAVLAQASRLWAPYDPDLAATYLASAESAWDFLQAHPTAEPAGGFTNPPGVCTGNYTDPDGDVDERAWAAAELYRATGATAYHTAFETYWTQHDPLWGWNDWQHQQRKASWAYVNTAWPDANPAWQGQIRDAFVAEADTLLQRTQTNPYHNGGRLDVPVWIGWGTFTQSTRYAFSLMQAYALVEDPRYRDAALLNLNAQLGANPLGMSFVTGIGARYPQDPLHMPSLYDGIDEPVPGLPVFGPMAVMSNANPFQAAVQSDANSYPYAYGEQDPYPILRRYVDTNELPPLSEFTVQEMGWTAGVLGLFACALSADVTADGRVDPEDLQGVVARWRLSAANPDPDGDSATANYEPRFDLDEDGAITVRDVMWVTAELGQTCP